MCLWKDRVCIVPFVINADGPRIRPGVLWLYSCTDWMDWLNGLSLFIHIILLVGLLLFSVLSLFWWGIFIYFIFGVCVWFLLFILVVVVCLFLNWDVFSFYLSRIKISWGHVNMTTSAFFLVPHPHPHTHRLTLPPVFTQKQNVAESVCVESTKGGN